MKILLEQGIHTHSNKQQTLYELINERIAIGQKIKELQALYDSMGEEIIERMQDNDIERVYGREYGYNINYIPRYHYGREVLDLLTRKDLLSPFVKMTQKGLYDLFKQGLISQEEFFFIEENTEKTYTPRLQEVINPDARIF